MTAVHENGGYRVPDPLMQRLHEANVRFSFARQRLVEAFGSGHRTPARIDAAHGEVRNAERELETVSEEISQFLHG